MSDGERALRRSFLFVALIFLGIGLVFPETVLGKITLVENTPVNFEGSPVYQNQVILSGIEDEHGKDFITLILTQESEPTKFGFPEAIMGKDERSSPEEFYIQVDRNGLSPDIGSYVHMETYEDGCTLVKYSESVSQGGSLFRRLVYNETKGTTVYKNITCNVQCGCEYSQKTSIQKQESLIKFTGIKAFSGNFVADMFRGLFTEALTLTK